MDWSEAQKRLLAEKGYGKVAKATGLHLNTIRSYATGTRRPRIDNAQKVIDYLLARAPSPDVKQE